MLPFLTAYDPLGGSAISIDPLGALQSYGVLADLLLPGVTTITNRSRYLSMLCAALSIAEDHREFQTGAAGLAERRKAVEPFERLWALACVAASSAGIKGAADGLRGVTWVEKPFLDISHNRKKITTDFQLLKYQSRTGAVGTYWTVMIGAQLVNPFSGELTNEGQQLARQFPPPPINSKDRRLLADPGTARRALTTLQDLIAWSKVCHLAAAENDECKLLADALTANERRECFTGAILRLSAKHRLPEKWDIPWLKRLRTDLAKHEQSVLLGLPIVVEGIIFAEQFHDAALAVFRSLLWWGTQNAGKSIQALLADHDFKICTDRARETSKQLLNFRANCQHSEIRNGIEGLASFAFAIDRCTTHREVLHEVTRQHQRVQSGKIYGGVPKSDWITFDAHNQSILRPSPRFQLTERPRLPVGDQLTHPYRLEPFIYMLQENYVIRRDHQSRVALGDV